MLTELSKTFEKYGLYRLLRLLFNNPKSLCLRFGCFSHHDEEIDSDNYNNQTLVEEMRQQVQLQIKKQYQVYGLNKK